MGNDVDKWNKLIPLLRCLECKHDLALKDEHLECTNCSKVYPIVDGIPRFVPESFYSCDNQNDDVVEKTKNYFGFEWDYFKDWGFIPDEEIASKNNKEEYFGGIVSHRKFAFDSKCRLTDDELGEKKVILDAGCGNGRYTYEAASRGKGLVIGVDVGYGSVTSARDNTKDLDNVIIIQGSLFDLPFHDGVIDSCFSNGVLMHTGNAKKAFFEVSRVIKDNGIFVAHLYQKLNPVWEFTDQTIRKITTKLSIENNMRFAGFMVMLAKILSKIPKGLATANLFFRLQPTKHHMFDWYAAPVATHHTYDEVNDWFEKNNMVVLDKIPEKPVWYKRNWALNLKGQKK